MENIGKENCVEPQKRVLLDPEKALGVLWNTKSDEFYFSLKTIQEKIRRTMLSTLASIYDSLRLGAPFIIAGKIIFQKKFSENTGWENPFLKVQRNPCVPGY